MLLDLIKEVHVRLSQVDDNNQVNLLLTMKDTIEKSILDPFKLEENNEILAYMLIITIEQLPNKKQELLKNLWKSLMQWRHHQGILVNFTFELLESFGEAFWINTIRMVFGWIDRDLINQLIYKRLSPLHITKRKPITNTKVSSLLASVKKQQKNKNELKKIYDPNCMNDCHIAFFVLASECEEGIEKELIFYSLIFKFDECVEEVVQSTATKLIDNSANLDKNNTIQDLNECLNKFEQIDSFILEKSFACACSCLLKSASIISWKIFSKLAPLYINDLVSFKQKVLSIYISFFQELNKSQNSIEKNLAIILASLDAISNLICQLPNANTDLLIIELCNFLLMAPKKEIFMRGFNLIKQLKPCDINNEFVLRGLFLIDEYDSDELKKFLLFKNILLGRDIDYLRILDPTLISIWKRPSLRINQFWPKFLAHYKQHLDLLFSSLDISIITDFSNYLQCCQTAIEGGYLQKTTLLSIIDNLALIEDDLLIDDYMKKFIPKTENIMNSSDKENSLVFEIDPFIHNNQFQESLILLKKKIHHFLNFN